MGYTVNKLAKLAGVTVRTIQYYNAIGLLKPAYCSENGYRYYENKQLLTLQKILFFRELGMKLNDIKKALSSNHCEQKELLLSHQFFLKKKVLQIKELIKTIDKTIDYLEGKRLMMSASEVFEGFFAKGGRSELYARYFLENNLIMKEDLDAAYKKIRTWDMAIWQDITNITNKIIEGIAYSMKNHFKNDSIHVQDLIAQHYHLTERYLPLNKDAYISLSELYCEHKSFRDSFNGPINPTDGSHMHEGLVDYLAEGMRIYAAKELTPKPTESEVIRTFQPS